MFDREVFSVKPRPSRLGLSCLLMALACASALMGATVEKADAQSTPSLSSSVPSSSVPSMSVPSIPVQSTPSQPVSGASVAPDMPQPSASSPAGTTNSFSGIDANLSPEQLQALVGPIAIYPDDLLGLVLTASTQPLEIVEARRYLEASKTLPAAKPPQTWDPSVIALLNYPDVIKLMDADLAWTQQLGTSVIAQRAALLDAIQSFRREAYRAGNLQSNDKETVTVSPDASAGNQGQDDTISIAPAQPQVIYVPSYDPATVAVPAPSYDWSAYDWSPAYPYYGDPDATFFPGFWTGGIIGFGFGWHDHEIFLGDDHHDRDHFRDRDDHFRDRDDRVGDRENGRVGSEADGHLHLAPGVAIGGRSIWMPAQNAVRQTSATGNLATGIGIDGRSIRSRDQDAARQARADATGRGPAVMRPAVAAPEFGHAPASTVPRALPQIMQSRARINSAPSPQVFRGTPVFHNGAAMSPRSFTGPRSAGPRLAAPIGAPRASMAVRPIQGGVGMVHGGVEGGGMAGGYNGGGHR